MNRKLKRTVFPLSFVFLVLNLSSAKGLSCSVTRWKAGDRILFVDYNHHGICNAGFNPCQGIDGSEWKYSTSGCTCHCSSFKSTYREDKHACVVNSLTRDGRYHSTFVPVNVQSSTIIILRSIYRIHLPLFERVCTLPFLPLLSQTSHKKYYFGQNFWIYTCTLRTWVMQDFIL